MPTLTPLTVSLGTFTYDAPAMCEAIAAHASANFIDADQLALSAGSVKAVNTVLVGAAFGRGLLDIIKDSLIEAIRMNVPPKFFDMNLRAFEIGAAY